MANPGRSSDVSVWALQLGDVSSDGSRLWMLELDQRQFSGSLINGQLSPGQGDFPV